MPKGYIIGHITVTDPEGYPEYVQKDTPILESFGAKFIVRGGQSQTPEGEAQIRHVVIEFPSYQAALDCYNSDTYQAARKHREPVSTASITLIEGME